MAFMKGPLASEGRAGVVQLASVQEAIAGLNTTKAVTPAALKEAIFQNVDLIKFVATLPETGESKYLYCVPQNETDLEGYGIVVLYIWNISQNAWNSVHAFSIDIDPDTLVYKTDKNVANGVAGLNANAQLNSAQIPYATSSNVGGIKQTFDAATGTWTVTVEEV